MKLGSSVLDNNHRGRDDFAYAPGVSVGKNAQALAIRIKGGREVADGAHNGDSEFHGPEFTGPNTDIVARVRFALSQIVTNGLYSLDDSRLSAKVDEAIGAINNVKEAPMKSAAKPVEDNIPGINLSAFRFGEDFRVSRGRIVLTPKVEAELLEDNIDIEELVEKLEGFWVAQKEQVISRAIRRRLSVAMRLKDKEVSRKRRGLKDKIAMQNEAVVFEAADVAGHDLAVQHEEMEAVAMMVKRGEWAAEIQANVDAEVEARWENPRAVVVEDDVEEDAVAEIDIDEAIERYANW